MGARDFFLVKPFETGLFMKTFSPVGPVLRILLLDRLVHSMI